MRLTKEQEDVMTKLLQNKDREQAQTLGGYAGTGKTTVLGHLAQHLPGWACCAFTGRASHMMRRRGMTSAKTIHGTIYTCHQDEDGTPRFALRTRAELGAVGGYLADESSTIGKRLYEDLLSFGLPIILCGDHGQLPPAGEDSYLMQDPMYRLEHIHRNAGPIAHFAEHLRMGGHPRTFPGGEGVHVLPFEGLDDDLLLHAGQMICAFNSSRVNFNAAVRRLRGRKHLLEVGDRIICLRNHSRAGLFNGQMGKVLSVDLKRCRMTFKSDDEVYTDIPFDPDVFGDESPRISHAPGRPHPFDYAYAITCHKAQGGEWRKVTAVEQRCGRWDHTRWCYTAASRAKRHLNWILPDRG